MDMHAIELSEFVSQDRSFTPGVYLYLVFNSDAFVLINDCFILKAGDNNLICRW